MGAKRLKRDAQSVGKAVAGYLKTAPLSSVRRLVRVSGPTALFFRNSAGPAGGAWPQLGESLALIERS